VRILALTLDLDDTLWPVLPALERADHEVDAWLQQHHPDVARAWPVNAMRELRMKVASERPDLAHDFSMQRQLTLEHAFASCGIASAPVDALWDVYFAARNRVELYPGALAALERLKARWPIASLTNGNADLERVGIHVHFDHHISARNTGAAKPDPRIFQAAVERLNVPPENILHVGDDAELDVVGARNAGMRTAWINRQRLPWPVELGPPPDADVADMTALAQWLESRHPGA
jgi:2-haloalkanoic acid dehalogenase type II